DTISWSYNLLDPLEQSLLRRLSIFDGDCALDAIEAVCSGHELTGGADRLEGTALLDALAALVDLHLVEPEDGMADEARFGMLAIIREFAREQLVDGAEFSTLRSRHAEWYATLVDQAAAGLQSRDARTWALRLEHDLVELRAALQYFLDSDDVVGGLRM